MKIRIGKWIDCGLAALTLMGVIAPSTQAGAQRVSHRRSYRTLRPRYRRGNLTGASVARETSIPNQSYTNYVTGAHALYTLPGTVRGSRRLLTKGAMKRLAERQIPFMTYRKAVTNRGSIYYKIVSQHHSVRGWMYYTAIRSILDRNQQAASAGLNDQITQAELLADESKHQSLADRSTANLDSAWQALKRAQASVAVLKGTPDYRGAKASLRAGRRYLRRINSSQPSLKTIHGIETIKSEYDQAAKAVDSAQQDSLNHHADQANRDIEAANRSLKKISRILSTIHNHHDRRVAMALFNHALGYVNRNYSFDPVSDLNSRNVNSRRLSTKKAVALINSYERDAQASIMDLYPNLDNFDVALKDAYQAQNDLIEANGIIANLKNSHVKANALQGLQDNQHQINALWNV